MGPLLAFILLTGCLHPAYGTYFFKVAGINNSFQSACILTGVGVVAIVANSIVITRIGRRRVFLTIGLIICGFSQLISAIIWTVKPGSSSSGKGIVAFAVIYIVGYNVCRPFKIA